MSCFNIKRIPVRIVHAVDEPIHVGVILDRYGFARHIPNLIDRNSGIDVIIAVEPMLVRDLGQLEQKLAARRCNPVQATNEFVVFIRGSGR